MFFKPRIPQWADLRNPAPVDDISFFEQRALELGTPLKKSLRKTNAGDQENIDPLAKQVQELKIDSSNGLDVAKLSKNAAPGSYGDLSSLALLNPMKRISERVRRKSQLLTLELEKAKSTAEADSQKEKQKKDAAAPVQFALVRQNSVVLRRSTSVTKVFIPPTIRRRASVEPSTQNVSNEKPAAKPVAATIGTSQMTLRPRTGTGIIVSQRDAQRNAAPAVTRSQIVPRRRSVNKAAIVADLKKTDAPSATTSVPKPVLNPVSYKATRTSLLREQANALKNSQQDKPIPAPRRLSVSSKQKTVEKKS